jgi:hypothetical protein
MKLLSKCAVLLMGSHSHRVGSEMVMPKKETARKISIVSAICLVAIILGSTSHASIITVTDQASWQSMVGTWTMVGFEGFLGPVADQYPGVTFGEFNGGSPYSAAIFPYEGANSMFTVQPMSEGNGGWAADFTTPVQAVAFWSDDVQSTGSRVYLFDSGNTLLGDYELMGSGGGHGAFSYGFNGFISSSLSISRIAVAISGPELPAGDAVWFDNFQFSPASGVPEPCTTIWLLGSAFVGLVLGRRWGQGSMALR